jgi:hypothetical protein
VQIEHLQDQVVCSLPLTCFSGNRNGEPGSFEFTMLSTIVRFASMLADLFEEVKLFAGEAISPAKSE